MPVVQEEECHPTLIWVECPECGEKKPIKIGNTSPETKKSNKNKKQTACRDTDNGEKKVVRHYRAGERFIAGEWIYHQEWDDTGQILEKNTSTGGHEIIVVSFEKVGTKRLVSNFVK
jgi:adenine-specific DNA methylase